MEGTTIADDTQHLTTVRSLVERLAEELRRPDPNLVVAQVLADVSLEGLRKLEQAAVLQKPGT